MHEVKHSTAASVSIAIQLRRGRGIPGASLRLKTNHGFVWSLSKAEIPMIPMILSFNFYIIPTILFLSWQTCRSFQQSPVRNKASTTHRNHDPYDCILLAADCMQSRTFVVSVEVICLAFTSMRKGTAALQACCAFW